MTTLKISNDGYKKSGCGGNIFNYRFPLGRLLLKKALISVNQQCLGGLFMALKCKRNNLSHENLDLCDKDFQG